MLLHEYQIKSLLKRFQIPSPPYYLIESEKDIENVIQKAHLESGVIKAQIHAGGRGKAGAIKIAKTPEELKAFSSEVLGMKVINRQTGKDGITVKKIIITPKVEIQREIYLAITIDRKKGEHVLLASAEGGMEIEEIAKKSPSSILREVISEKNTIHRFQMTYLASKLRLKGPQAENFYKIIDGLLEAYFAFDATLLEINPLVVTESGSLLALDAKMIIDDNAIFRQPEMKYFLDETQLPPREAKAKSLDLAYVPLDGSIGCIVNGAGLAMATLDLLSFWGGKPANFLDVGGGATEEKVSQGFDLILSDPKVKVVFVNIFGGIMNCETIARALISSLRTYTKVEKKELPPIIVRMEGTNVHKAKEVLSNSGLPITNASTLDEAAQTAVLLAQR